MICVGFWKDFGCQNTAKIVGLLLEGLWGAKGPPRDPKGSHPGSTGKGREGVNPSPEG